MKKILKKNKLGLSIIFIIFIISSNIAWLNPAPMKDSYQPNKYIPFLWQYNSDSGIEILSAAYFPKVFKTDNTRIDRPMYPLVANTIGKIVGLVINPFYSINDLEKTGIGYILMKLLMYISALVLSYEIIAKYFKDKKIIIFTQFLIFFSAYSVLNAAVFHTLELQFITPIIGIYLFLNISNNYSLKKNLIFSLIIGILMLAKYNYAIYCSIILFSIINKRILESILSIIFHLIPLIIYIYFLKFNGFNYKFVGSEHGQISWLFDELFLLNFYTIIQTIYLSGVNYLILLEDSFDLWLILFILGSYKLLRKENYHIFFFIIIFIFFNWLQIFVSNRPKTYLTNDLMIVIYPIVAFYAVHLLNLIKEIKIQKYLIIITFVIIATINMRGLVNFPWVHPYDQPAKNVNRMNERLNEIKN